MNEDGKSALRNEFAYRIRTAVAYGIGRGKRDDKSSEEIAAWIDSEIDAAMAVMGR